MSAYSDAVIADGATNYWRLNETTGPTAVDSIGGANGTISGGVTLGVSSQPGLGTGLSLDGTTGTITTGGPAVVIPLACSIECWFKAPPGSGGNRALVSTLSASSGGTIAVYTSSGVVSAYAGTGSSFAGGPGFHDSAWHHLVFTCTGSSGSMFVDGGIRAGPSVHDRGASASTGAVKFGSEPAFGGVFWLGEIDDIAIYPHVLTPAQISNHYALGLVTGPLAVTTATRPSTAVLSSPSVRPPSALITTPFRASTVQLSAPSLGVSAWLVTLPAIAAGSLVLAPTVSSRVGITTGARASTTTLFSPTLIAGLVSVVTPGRIASTVLFAPDVYVEPLTSWVSPLPITAESRPNLLMVADSCPVLREVVRIQENQSMAANVTIGGARDLYIGEDKRLEFEILNAGSPDNLTGWTVLFDVRPSVQSPTALVSKPATIEGAYDPTRSINTQRAVVNLTDEDLSATNFTAGNIYQHSLKRTNEGAELILAYGRFMLERASQV